MLKKTGYFILIAAIFVSFSITDSAAFNLGGKKMVKNGTGTRTKFPVGTVYYASLYVPEALKGKSAKAIIEADQPMSVIMKIDTGLLTKERFIKAIKEGFAKAASSGYSTNKEAQFFALINKISEVKKYDTIYLNYVPGAGTMLRFLPKATGKVTTIGTVGTLQFKKALFAIWLGPKPVQEKLKKGMLGQ